MVSLRSLKTQASEATNHRGHTMKWAKPYHGKSYNLQNGECAKCGAWVQINSNPAPDGIDIGGTAVAIGCNPATPVAQ